MDLKIIETKEQPLLSRKEILAEASFEGATPSRKEIAKELSKKVGNKEELLVIKNVYSAYGFKKAEIAAYVYQDKGTMEKYELNHLLKRGKSKEAEKKEGEQ